MRALDRDLRAGARGHGRQERRPARAAAGPGLLTLGNGCSVEPEVDLRGHWLDGDVLRVGRVRIDKRATVGTRSTLAPGTRVGAWSEIAPGSAVVYSVPPGERGGGSPAVFDGPARRAMAHDRAPRTRTVGGDLRGDRRRARGPARVAGLCGCSWSAWRSRRDDDPRARRAGEAAGDALRAVPLAAVTVVVVLAVATLAAVRLLGLGFREGYHAVHSRAGWRVWATLRLMDDARTTLFPLYSSLATPVWLRLLGADIGKDVEASTALMLPTLTTVGEGAFLADDTLIGSYELGHGWLRVERSKVGKRAFLGNSG